jgi:hypothetical protein
MDEAVKEPVKEKVKSLNVYRFSDEGAEDVADAEDLTEAMRIREVIYDEKGHVIRETELDEDGNASEMYVRSYNEKGAITEMQHFYEGALSEKTLYQYDADGLLTGERLEYADGSVMHTTYSFDDLKNVTGKKTVDDEGNPDSREEAVYSGKTILELSRYDDEDKLKEKRSLKYREDNPELLLEEVVIDTDNNTELRTVFLDNEAGSVTYSKEGKVHTRQKMVYDEKKRVLENSISSFSGNYHYAFSYDEKDNVTEEVRTLNGTVFFRTINLYHDNGLLKARSVTEMNSGFFTDVFRYEYYT